MPARTQRPRRPRRTIARRWLAVAALALVGLLYYRPLHDYLEARAERAASAAAVRRLQREQASLERRLRLASSPAVLAREARTLGYVRPGEHLYIVENIQQWRHRQQLHRHAAAGAHRP